MTIVGAGKAVADDTGPGAVDGGCWRTEGADLLFRKVKSLSKDVIRSLRSLGCLPWIHECLGGEEVCINEAREQHSLEEREGEGVVR